MRLGRWVTTGLVAAALAASPAVAQEVVISAQDASAGNAPADGGATAARLSGDGSLAVFTSAASNLTGRRDLADEVFLRDPATQTTRELYTGAGAAFDPALSADGRWATYVVAPQALKPGNLNLVDLATGRRRVIGRHASWDGVSWPSTVPQPTAHGEAVVWARQGSGGAVYLWRRGHGNRMVARVRAGTMVGGLSIDRGGRHLAWSQVRFNDAPSERVTVRGYDVRRRRATVVDRMWAAGGNLGWYDTSLSGSGRYLAYVDRPFDDPYGRAGSPTVRLFDARTRRSRVVSRADGRTIGGYGPSLSADGTQLAFSAIGDSTTIPVVRDLRQTAVTQLAPAGFLLTLSADGHAYAYIRSGDGTREAMEGRR